MNLAATLIGQLNFLYPSTTGTTFRKCCNKYQCFIWQPGSTTARYHVAFGVPYVWSFLSASLVGDCGWICGDSINDTGTSTVNFRRCLRTQDSGGNNRTTVITGATLLNLSQSGCNASIQLIGVHGLGYTNPNGGCTFADGSMIVTEPMIGWGYQNSSDNAVIRGQLWDAVVLGSNFAADGTISLDSHTWRIVTINYGDPCQGTLCVLSS